MENEGTILYQDQYISVKSLLVGAVCIGGVLLILSNYSQWDAEGKNPLVGILACLAVATGFLLSVRVQLFLKEDRIQFKTMLNTTEYLFVGMKGITAIAMTKAIRESKGSVEVHPSFMPEPVTARVEAGSPKRWRQASHAILLVDKDPRLNYIYPHPDAEKIASLAKQQFQKSRS